jgi:hypothetical protein
LTEFNSGTLTKTLGLEVVSVKNESRRENISDRAVVLAKDEEAALKGDFLFLSFQPA